MDTYRQYLAARALAEYLLIKYGEETAKPKMQIHGDVGVSEELEKVAAALGYRVVPIAVAPHPINIAAE